MMFKNSKFLLVLSLAVSAFLIVVLIGAIYAIRTKNAVNAELLAVARETDEAKVRAQLTRALRVERESALEAFENLVLSEDKFVNLIETIERAGKELGLETEVSSVDKKEDSKIIKIAVEARGSWGEAFSFLALLENLPYKATVEESNLSKVGGAWDLRAILSLNYFD